MAASDGASPLTTCRPQPRRAPPAPALYPVQRGLTGAMRDAGMKAGDVERMQAWAGKGAALARAAPAAEVARDLWDDARALPNG